MLSQTKLQAIAVAMEAESGITTTANANSQGRWKKIALAAEGFVGVATVAAQSEAGYMLRTAAALETLAGTDGTAENRNYDGLAKRIYDALAVLTGATGVSREWAQRIYELADDVAGINLDRTPAAFSFTDNTDVVVATVQTSDAITVSAMHAGVTVPVTITGGTYSKNGGAYTSAAGVAANTDTFTVRHTSSAIAATAVNTVLTIGGVSDTFTSTTAA